MHPFSFEKLEVWRLSRELCKRVYDISRCFPSEEKFTSVQQIRRAAVSVTCNLAEGSSRHKGPDKARFTEIAYGSLLEVLNLLVLAVDLHFIPQSIIVEVRPLIEEIANKLNRLRESQLRLP